MRQHGWAQVIAPAIRLVAKGSQSPPRELADSIEAERENLSKHPSTAAIFFKPDGSGWLPGERLVQADLAQTLKTVAELGSDGFFKGAVAENIVKAVQAAGGPMTVADLAAYKPIVREPVRRTYRGYDIVSIPLPSSGGVHLIQILNTLEGYPIGALGQNSAETIHLMAEAMKLAYADRSEYLGDPDFVDVPVAALTSKAYAAEMRLKISSDFATPSAMTKPGDLTSYESDQATHFSVVDRHGNAVANIISEKPVMASTQSSMRDAESGVVLGASDPRRPDAATVGF